ncbi:glycosyltransferase family 1 protein [Dokdonia sinensis]|uniref:Glycosyltransferase family 1 protein n=1 Tax=Dokdonia sinensis TaxID=2479847 RepID=A0A3M0G6C7_9FLAO|nr:glycosyltransferase [Dokdonia sinensis]RMB60465.1 glycosyltransferase family 1 protein [Dokdonia sinensis]
MNILLIGEYSRFHNSLKEGLIALGHEVTLVGTGDDFKKFPVDVDISPRYTMGNWFVTKIRRGIFKITGTDITAIEIGNRFAKALPELKNYDVVQLINSWSIRTTPSREQKFIKKLALQNKKMFLSACGTDVYWVEDLLTSTLPYHMLTPYVNDKNLAPKYQGAMRYLKSEYKALYETVMSHAEAIIPTDMDYYLSLRKNIKATKLIPTPINLSKLDYTTTREDQKIVIFHGINRQSYLKKGNDIFEKALEIIKKSYSDKIEIITVESLPYSEYIKAYDRAHILLDQVYSHDQGYNALEAMAKGKVVFTGAGPHFMKHYNLTEPVAIDATPDPNEIAFNLEKLILNPSAIPTIGKSAKAFVQKYHDHIEVAREYVTIWQKN